MTTATVTPRSPGMKVTQVRVRKSEWTKFRSLRSSSITLLIGLTLMIGLSALISAVTASQWSQMTPARRADFNAIVTSIDGINIAQLAIGVLGVLLISGEYSTGMIRASLTAVPKRLPVLWAKLSVFSAVVGVSSVLASFASFFLGQALLSSQNLDTTIGAPGALRMVVGAGIYLLLIGVMGMALGALLRNTAAGISALVALFFVIPPLMGLLPSSFGDAINKYLPSNAGEAFWGHPTSAHLQPWTGLAVLMIWVGGAIALAAFRLKTADA